LSTPVNVVTPPPVGVGTTSGSASWFCVAATILSVCIAGYWAGRVALFENHHEDLWIYSSGSWFGFHGISPYSIDRMHDRVHEQYPNDENLKGNNGFFLTPQALFVMAPFAALPWLVAKLVWCATMIAIAVVTAWQLRTLSDRVLPEWFTTAAVVGLLVNPLTLFVLIVGQTPLILLACIVFGQAAYRRGWNRFGSLLWAVAFIKPHIALALIPLAFWLNGWKRAFSVVIWAGVLNVAAGVVFYGNPFFVFDYLLYVQQGHQSVEFNRVSVNKQITSWNRILAAAAGLTKELGMVGTLCSYFAVTAIVACRVWFLQNKPNLGWKFAVAGSSMFVCCQLLPYELPLVIVLLPYIAELLASQRRSDQVAAGLFVGLIVYAMLPGGDCSDYYRLVRFLFEPFDAWMTASCGQVVNVTDLLLSHRSLGVCTLFLGVVGYGPAHGAYFLRTRLAGTETTASASGATIAGVLSASTGVSG
jgi:hypothetical protein